jgi:hypothetical protein
MAAAHLGAAAGLILALAGGGPPGFAADASTPLVLEKTISLSAWRCPWVEHAAGVGAAGGAGR